MARQLLNRQQLGSRPLASRQIIVRLFPAANDAAGNHAFRVFLLAEREPHHAKLQLCLDLVDESPKIGKLDSRDGVLTHGKAGLALANRVFVLENRSSSLSGLVADIVGLVLPTAETRVDLERINLMSRRDSILQFR